MPQGIEPETRPSFSNELESLINRYSKENVSNTPDFILANFIEQCLHAFNYNVGRRDEWYGVDLHPALDRTKFPAR